VALLIGIAVMVAAALHLLPLWVAYLIFAVLWVGFCHMVQNSPMI